MKDEEKDKLRRIPPGKSTGEDNIKQQTAEAELERIKLINRSDEQNIKDRKKYGYLIYYLVIGWLVILSTILFFYGFNVGDFTLPDGVLIALIAGTTVKVVGLLAIIVNYLFPKQHRNGSYRRSKA